MKKFDKYLARFVRVLAAVVLIFMNSLPMKLFISGLRILTKGLVRLIWAVNKALLVIARSPVTLKILGAFGKVFSLFGGFIGAIFSGLAFFFRMIGRGIAGAYAVTADALRNPLNFDLGISLPGSKKVTFGSGKGDPSRKKSAIKIKGAKKANIAKPAAKPMNKTSISVQGTAKFNQITKPSGKKPIPVPPKLKGAENLQQIPGTNKLVGDSNAPVGANNSNNKTPGNSPLGYFEDEPF